MSSGPYRVSPELLAREDFRAACAERNFTAMFLLMKKWDGTSQDKIASQVPGLSQSRVSEICRGVASIQHLHVIEKLADGLRIPGGYFGLAPRPWESGEAVVDVARAEAAVSAAVTTIGAAPVSTPATGGAGLPAAVGDVIDRQQAIEIEVDADGWATVTYRHELHNASSEPFTRFTRELWFEHTTGSLTLEAIPGLDPDRNVIVQRIHDTALNTKFACQLFPALQPGESARFGYTCTGGRFVYDHFWRQSTSRPTDELTIRLRHAGITSLGRCSASEERPDGSEVSATESLTWHQDEGGVAIELTRKGLRPNQAVTLRWDPPRVPA
jgi:hypothetical protein